MPPRDAQATRQRLLDAARAEFATYGIAGARTDRIAANARANKAQIYHYFGSKDQLFDAVWEALVRQVVDEAPIDTRNLPEYAAALSDGYAAHPDLARLVTWQRLQRHDEPPHQFAVENTKSKVVAIARAQDDGVIPADIEPGVLLALVLNIAAMWVNSAPDVLAAVGVGDAEHRREAVKGAVRRLLG
jgi:AcrR family transcriptional regulator